MKRSMWSKRSMDLWIPMTKMVNVLVTSLTEEECVRATRFMLKLKQENKLNEVGNTYSGTVDGKL
jgi:3-hydroxy-3-methylglutaryl CoA synthase